MFLPRGPVPLLRPPLSARTDPRSLVSLYRADADSDPTQIEQVEELAMLTTAAKPVEGVGRDGHVWHMEAYLLPVDAGHDFGVFVRASDALRQDLADIRVLFFPYP